MTSERKTATIIGLLFIIAAVTSVIAIVLYGSILTDDNYVIMDTGNKDLVIAGAIFELFLAASAIGTSITFFPILKKHNETLALGYVTFRFFEAVLIVTGALALLTISSLNVLYVAGSITDTNTLVLLSKALVILHDWTFIIGPNFMLGINTSMYSYILYKSRIVPNPLSILGRTAAALIFFSSFFEMFGFYTQVSFLGVFSALPIAVFEMSLAGYLIIKGFKEKELNSLLQS